MTYELDFHPDAKREWDKLDGNTRSQFKKKLAERLEQPHVPSAAIKGSDNLYKIKLRALGYRLVYRVDDLKVTVLVLSVGRRDRPTTYQKGITRV